MNDTTRDELVDKIQVLLEATYDSGKRSDALRGTMTSRSAASALVEEISAARDAEIREALLSSSMHDAVDEHLYSVVASGWLREVFRAGLDHIGLLADETGEPT